MRVSRTWKYKFWLGILSYYNSFHPPTVGATPPDDDVFVNLDAFDMFVEFPDLELDTKHGFLSATSDYLNPVGGGHAQHLQHSHHGANRNDTASNDAIDDDETGHQLHDTDDDAHRLTSDMLTISSVSQQQQAICTISDYSPEWSYTDGGVKVLVTGPWECTTTAALTTTTTTPSATAISTTAATSSSPTTNTSSSSSSLSSTSSSSFTSSTSSAPTSTSVTPTAPNYTVLFDAFPVPTTLVQAGVLRCFCPAHEVGFATVQVACDGYIVSNAVVFEYKAQPPVAASMGEHTTTTMVANDTLFRLSLFSRLEAVDERLQIKAEPKEKEAASALLAAAAAATADAEERLVGYCQALSAKQWRSMTPGTWTVRGHRGMTLLHLAAALGYTKLVCVLLAWRAESPNAVLETEVDALSEDQLGWTPLMWSLAGGHGGCARILYRWNGTAMNVRNRAQQTALEVCQAGGWTQLAVEFGRLEADRRQRARERGGGGFLSAGGYAGSADEDPYRRQLTHSNPMFGSSAYGLMTTGGLTAVAVDGGLAAGQLQSHALLGSGIGEGLLLQQPMLDADCGSPMSMSSMGSMYSGRSHDGVFLRPGAVSR